MIGRGVAYRKTEETDLLRSKRGPVDQEGCGVPQNKGNGLVLERYGRNGVLFMRRGVAYRKTGLHGILLISTVDITQPPRATIHPRRHPPASSCDCSSMGSCSSSLHRALLHRLLFNQPSPRAPVQPPLHGLLFIQPSTSYCSTSPPRGPVHPGLHGVLFIQPPLNCSSTPQQHSLFIKGRRQQCSIGFS